MGELRQSRPITSQLQWLLVAAIHAGLLVSVVRYDYLPTNDGPQHVFVGHVVNEIAKGNGSYSSLFRAGDALSPLGFDFLFGTLSPFMPWRLALRLTLGFIALIWATGAVALCGAIHPTRRLLGLVGAALALQWAFYMGFFSFVLSLGIAWWGLLLLLRGDIRQWRVRAGFAAICVLASVSHTFGGLFLAACGVFVGAFTPNRLVDRLGSAGWMLLLASPGLAVWVHSTQSLGFLSRLSAFESTTSHWLSVSDRLVLISRGFVVGGDWRFVFVTALVALGITSSVTAMARRRITAPETVLLVISLCAFVAFFLSPLHLRAWELVSPRFLPIGVMTALPLVPLEEARSAAQRAMAIAGLAVASCGMLVQSGLFHDQLVRGCAPALEGLAAKYRTHGMRLPVFVGTCGLPTRWQDSPVPFMQPLMNAGALYAVEQGGVVPNTFTVVPQIHVLTKTEAYWERMPEAPNRQIYLRGLMLFEPGHPIRVAAVSSIVDAGKRFDDVVIYGAPDLRHALEEAGYRPVWSNGDVAGFRFAKRPHSS